MRSTNHREGFQLKSRLMMSLLRPPNISADKLYLEFFFTANKLLLFRISVVYKIWLQAVNIRAEERLLRKKFSQFIWSDRYWVSRLRRFTRPPTLANCTCIWVCLLPCLYLEIFNSNPSHVSRFSYFPLVNSRWCLTFRATM